MRFGENDVLCPKYIDIYEFGGYVGACIFHRTFFVYYSKKRKKYKSMTYTKIKLSSFWFDKFFSWMNNTNFTKRGPKGAPLLYLYKVSIVVLINFIAILLTPGIFLIQIVKSNNTNIYLIHFHRKNSIKMRFPKVEFLKFQTSF